MGTNGKTAVVSLIAAMLAAAGRAVGQAGARGLRVGRRVLSEKSSADANSARRLLLNPFVDAMVVETSEIDIIREGLAFDRCDVAVVTGLGEGDYSGEQYVDGLLVAKAVRAPVDVVLPEGYAVLNADDAGVVAMAEKCRGKIVYFARSRECRVVREHLRRGGQAVFVVAGCVVAAHADKSTPVLELANVASDDVLAAVGAGIALGLDVDAIRRGCDVNHSPR